MNIVIQRKTKSSPSKKPGDEVILVDASSNVRPTDELLEAYTEFCKANDNLSAAKKQAEFEEEYKIALRRAYKANREKFDNLTKRAMKSRLVIRYEDKALLPAAKVLSEVFRLIAESINKKAKK